MGKTAAQSISPIGVVPLGVVGEVAVHIVVANLQTVLGVPVDILAFREVPARAFQPQRQQYDAGLIIEHLARLSLDRYSRLLALTHVDLCIPILTHVFGEAELGGGVAVVSDFRLRHNDDGSPAPVAEYYERLVKVALHEVAHTLSLYHCQTPRCLMNFSPAVGHLDQLSILFCDRCKYQLHKSFEAIREGGA